MSSKVACPICNMTKGLHKMDCQNRYYVDQQIKAFKEQLQKDKKWQT